jgi:prolyl-tRNA synthetase
MGGSQSHEFMVVSPAGEDRIAICGGCGYAANLEKARGRVAPVQDSDEEKKPEPFPTPKVRTIEELAAFTGMAAPFLMKSVVYAIPPAEEGSGEPELVLALTRGDHEVNEAKLADALGGAALRPAHPEEIRATFGASPGFLGPLGVKGVRILIDEALRGRRNLITGANRDDYHVRFITPERDFQGAFADLRMVADGDSCLECGRPLRVAPAIEVGHIFKLGRRYAESMGARVLDRDGKEVTPIMGSYGIGVERILSAAVEQHHDEKGMKLPRSIAPFEAVLTPTNLKEEAIRRVAEESYAGLRQAGVEVLYDDRDERAGVKFNDADLIGIPLRLTVGRKAAEGVVEITQRSTGERSDARISEIVELLKTRYRD